MKYLGKIQDPKDLVTKEYVDGNAGNPEAPYKQVEWVESNGTQFVYLDWKPTAGWGFEADFLTRNAFNTTEATIHATNNKNGYGTIFGTQHTTSTNAFYVSTYSTNGYFWTGSNVYSSAGIMKTDGTRQTIKLHGTTYTKPDGTTMTVSNSGTSPNWNMCVFARMYSATMPATYSNNSEIRCYSTTRLYSLKFYNGNTLAVDLVGAYRKADGCTGLWDKVSNHFYPAAGLLKGNDVGDLGTKRSATDSVEILSAQLVTTNTAATRLWTATANYIDKLEDGQQFVIRNRFGTATEAKATDLANRGDSGSSANVYMKLTLSNGTDNGWIPCYYSNYGRLTSHYGAGSEIRFVYRENVMVGTYGIARGFWADANYTDGNTTYTKYSDTVIAGKNGLKRYSLCMRDDEGNWTSVATQDNNVAATGKTAYTGGFQLGGANNVMYHSTNGVYAAGASAGNVWESYGGVDFRYNVNGVTNAAATTELQLRKPVYFVGTISNGLFYLDQTKWWTQTPTDTSKVYVLIGTAYSSYYAIFVAVDNPVYIYNGTKLVEQYYGNSSTVNGHTVNADVPSGAKFTDTVTTASTTGSGNAVTAISASNGALTVTKGTTFLTSHQDISGKADKSATVSTVTWDSTNKKLTKTINGSTTDVVTAATLRTGLNVADGAEVNQNAFSNVKVGSTTVAADAKTDTLELVAGSNVTLTPDATNDKVTIAATNTTYTAGDGLSLSSNKFSNYRGIEYIRGTWTAASGTWTGVTADSELYDGKQIILYMPFAGSGNATLNLTLAGGGTTGAKNVYFESTTRFTTHKGQNSQLHLIYHNAMVLSDGNTYSGWWYVANRDTNSNDSSTGYTRFSHGTYTTTTAVGRYVICLTKSLTSVVPVTAVNNSTATTKTLTTDTFNPFEPIFYYTNNGGTTQTAANTALNVSYLWRNYSNIDLRYSFNTGTTLTTNKDVFIKATPTSGYMATLADTPIVQDLPSSDDGFIYIKLGHACSTSNIAMAYEHPIYWYKNSAIRKYGDYGLSNVDNTADADKTVNKANQITTARYIDGVSFNGSANIHHRATVTMSSSTFVYESGSSNCKIKVNGTGFTPAEGAVLYVAFSGTPTLPSGASNTTPVSFRVNGTDATISYSNKTNANTRLTASQVVSKFKSGATYCFIFTNSTSCLIVGDLDSDTTYSGGTQAQLEAGTVETNYLWTPKILHDYIASHGGSSATTLTVTLLASGWNSGIQSVTATGVTASNTVIVSPAPTSFMIYANYCVYCSSQQTNSLTFACYATPTSNLTVNVLII